MPAPGQAARQELAVADQVLAQRRQLAITAARVARPRTSVGSWGSARAIRPNGRHGITASRGSSTTARSTASRIWAGRSVARPSAGPSEAASAAVNPLEGVGRKRP